MGDAFTSQGTASEHSTCDPARTMPRQAHLDASGVLHHGMVREIERAGASARMTPTARASWAAWRRWKRRPASRSTPEPSCRTTPTGWSGRAGQVMADFKVGDIVQLRSGGPKMTVVEEVNHLMMGVRPSALCNWFAGSKNEQKAFPPAALILLDEDASERTE